MAANRFTKCLVISILSAPLGALAHHGWSGYDSEKGMSVTGTIQTSGYEHPHGHVALKAKDKTWNVVLAPPYRMENRGLARDALKAGNEVTVFGYPHRETANEMRAERITANGKTVELR